MELSVYLETSISCPEPAGGGQQQQTMLAFLPPQQVDITLF